MSLTFRQVDTDEGYAKNVHNTNPVQTKSKPTICCQKHVPRRAVHILTLVKDALEKNLTSVCSNNS